MSLNEESDEPLSVLDRARKIAEEPYYHNVLALIKHGIPFDVAFFARRRTTDWISCYLRRARDWQKGI